VNRVMMCARKQGEAASSLGRMLGISHWVIRGHLRHMTKEDIDKQLEESLCGIDSAIGKLDQLAGSWFLSAEAGDKDAAKICTDTSKAIGALYNNKIAALTNLKKQYLPAPQAAVRNTPSLPAGQEFDDAFDEFSGEIPN